MPYVYKDMDRVVSEYCDLSDRKTLLKMTALNESEQSKALLTITGKLYDSIVEKVTDIDFGDIPKTKGDITQLPNYEQLVDTINTIKELIIEYKEDTKPIDVILMALNNIKDRTSKFTLAYKINAELPMVMYQTMVLAIISSTSLLISTCIEYVKDPNGTFDIMVNRVALKKNKDSLLYDSLQKFNQACSNGTVDRTLDDILKTNSKQLLGLTFTSIGVLQGVALVGLALLIIPLLRELIYFFYYSRVRISDYFNIQADLLQMNAYRLQNSQVVQDKEKTAKVANRQLVIVDKFRKIANFIEIKSKDSERKTRQEVVKTEKKFKSDEILDNDQPESASALF